MTLDDIAIRHGTDKASNGHFYTRHYEKFFAPIRGEIESVLEVGVGGGCSLKMWQDYFIGAKIYGVDQNECPDFGGRIHIFKCEQTDKDLLLEKLQDKKLQIIIEDASHDWEKSLITLDILWPILQPRGWYVIEDMGRSWFPEKIGHWYGERPNEIRQLYILNNAGNDSAIVFIQKT